MKYTYKDRGVNREPGVRRYEIMYKAQHSGDYNREYFTDSLPPQDPKQGLIWDFAGGEMVWNGKGWSSCKDMINKYIDAVGYGKVHQILWNYDTVDDLADQHETVRVLRDKLLMAIKLCDPDY